MMTTIRRENAPTFAPRDERRPRSPSEALEPGRAPARPRGAKARREPRASSGFLRFISSLLTSLLVLLVAAGSVTMLLYHIYERPGPLPADHVLVIPKGEGRIEIPNRLEREGVIANRWAFIAIYLGQRWFGPKPGLELKAGEYEIKKGASMRDVLDVLAEGKSVGYRVAVPEGLTSQQIVERLKADANLSGEIATIPTEGSLAPETYGFSKGSERADIIARMQIAQARILEEAWSKRQQGLPFETREQALVLASIVEKETGKADEREKVAAVFVNRLRKGMQLQSDPTILYGAYGGAVQWGKPIMQSEKDAKNAHNTYQIKGLPPTPICNPGVASIMAVLNPAKTDDLYFVADGSGGHIFTGTLKEHNAAVANWRKVEKEIRAKEAAAKQEKQESVAKQETPPTPAVVNAPAAAATANGDVDAIPNPPATDVKQAAAAAPPDAAAEPAVAQPAAAAQVSNVPLPIRKPKKQP